MELGEGEAQICRLCGQCESIYIDVFGEEGTKRFLGLKIHAKINILIEENDGLPQNVCMRCLGTLEFLCDFYERCHLTQKEFMQASKNESKLFQRDSDAESDKENTFPSTNDVKRKAKPLSPIHSKSTKNGLTLNNASYYRTESKDEISSPRRPDNSDCNNEVQSAADRAVQVNSNLVPKKQSTLDRIIVHEKNSKDEDRSSSSLKCRRSLISEKIDVPKPTVIRTAKSESMSNSINSIFKSINDGDMKSELPVRRKRGKKSKLEKMKEAGLPLSIKRKMRSNLDDNKTNDNQYKRHCLRAIFTNNKSKTPNSAVISSKVEVEQAVVDTMLSDSHGKSNKDKKNNIVSTNGPIFDNSVEAKTKEAFLKKKEDNSVTCKAISVIVKQEKVETEDAPLQRTGKSNQLVWIPNEMLMQEPEHRSRKVQQHTESSPVVHEMKRTESSESNTIVQSDGSEDSDVSTSTDREDLGPKMFAKQNRVTVIKSSQTKEISIEEKIGEDSEKLNVTADEMDDSAQDDLKDDVAGLPSSRHRRRNSSCVESKSRDRSFGKVSELISDEQKQVIETYYTVDMSIVNSKEVQENLTIIDKKNIRCNICGMPYLRMDKCQVHIWGHLQMKPYQCKACDFATVTVSNVRCHIRKSHLKIKPFACHLCEKRYVTSALLDEHINTHTGERPFKCKLCDFASASRQMLSYHTSTHKPIKDISCQTCGKKFYSRGRLRAHMIIHNKDKVVICKLCSAYLSNAESLETHHRNFHTQDYVCNVCGKRVKSRKALHNHQNVHAAAKYKCSLCPNVYKSSQILKEHLLKHKGIRKYKCNVCEKSFGQQSHLAAHMAVHSEIRFHCPACNKAFNRHDNMKIHTKRCKPFLANPDLKDLWNKKMKSASFSKTAELTEDFKNGDSSNSTSHIDDPDEESSMNNVGDKEKTGMNLCKLGLNISCIKSTDQAWSHDDVYADADGITRSAEISVIQILPENENVTVLENVLGPESF
ncbi:uncharacterized protein LOC143372441 [Andrena cerasifolii]|uniref:uncharacterized protein LOC143372441 n=1 Tax=Andrena cerasifolii TaxID=2819439 RepID=UPI004037E7AB